MLNAEKSRYSSGLQPRRGKAIYKVFLILIIIAAGFTNLYAQSGKVDIILKQPPPNRLGVGDMWNLELNNTTDKDIKIYLTGTATEEKDGLIIEGKSKPFTIKPGRSNYKYNDFSSAEVKYNNGKYKEIILRTGNAPEGSYTICVTAFDESGTEVGRENCIMQSVQQMGSITLLTPGDGEEIDPKMPIVFTWTPLSSSMKDGYSIKIAEVKEGKSPEEALNIWPWYDKQCPPNCIFENRFVLPLGEKKFEEGKKYAWQVSSGGVLSEVYSFSVRSDNDGGLEIDSIVCTGNPGEYRFWIKVCLRPNNTQFTTASINSIGLTNNCLPSGITYTISSIDQPALPRTITTPATGTNCENFSGIITTSPVSIATSIEIFATVNWGPQPNQVWYPSGISETRNNCCLPISLLPPMVGWWSLDESSGTTFFDRAGFNNEGNLVGSSGFVPGKVSNAFSFVNNHVSVPNHIDLNLGPCDSLFTIDAWIRASNYEGIKVIVEKREYSTCGKELGYSFFTYGGQLGFQIANGFSFGNYLSGSTLPTDNSWCHVAVTLERNPLTGVATIIFYLNGVVFNTSQQQQYTTPAGSLNNSAPLLIGCHMDGPRFNGEIDEVEIFKQVLTQPEINNIFLVDTAGKCKN